MQPAALLQCCGCCSSGNLTSLPASAHTSVRARPDQCRQSSDLLPHTDLPQACRDSQETDLVAFADHLAQNYTPNTVIVDATASDGPPAQYLDWMRKGVHVITPNKKLNSGGAQPQLSSATYTPACVWSEPRRRCSLLGWSQTPLVRCAHLTDAWRAGPLERYTELRHFQRGSYIHFLYEVCACTACPSRAFVHRTSMVHRLLQRMQLAATDDPTSQFVRARALMRRLPPTEALPALA